jgi:predicted secreted protein
MATAATKAQGTLLQGYIGGSYQTINEVLSITGPTLGSDLIEVTNHSSTGSYKEYIAGGKDGGEVSFDINYLPADSTHDATSGLLYMYNTDPQTAQAFKMIFTDTGNTEWTFNAVVQDFQISAEIGSQLTASCTLKVTGQPVLA